MKQLSIDFDPDITRVYGTCRELVQARVHQIGVPQKVIAADMDLSPSHLSRKLSQSPHDSMRFTLDDLEAYLHNTGDIEPVKYLIARFLYTQPPEQLQAQIDALQKQLKDMETQKEYK